MVEPRAHGTEPAVEAVREFLGGPYPDGDRWCFAFGEHLESNWGAVYGGALAAGVLAVARSVAPGQSPRSLHLQIVRSVPRGSAYANAELRHAGRTVATVAVDVYDERGKLAVVALVTMITPGAVAAAFHDTRATPFRERLSPVDASNGAEILAPVSAALQMGLENGGVIVDGLVENMRGSIDGTSALTSVVTVPWANLDATGPEAACLVADASIGMPVLRSFIPAENLGPNPDLSLRFTTAPATRVVKAASSMLSIQRGTATVTLEVQAGDQQLAHGLATSLLLNR